MEFEPLFEGGKLASAFEELRGTRDRIESILQLVVGDDGVLVQDFTGRIVYANAPAARMLGVEGVHELLRLPSSELLSRLVIEDEAGADHSGSLPGAAVLRGAPPSERTLRITGMDAQLRWAMVRTLPMHDDRRSVGAAVTILRDVTDQRNTADFRESLLGIASHDLRGPLGAISMAAAVIARHGDALDPRLARLVAQIQSSSDRATRMVHDLLDLTQARLGGGIPVEPGEVDVRSLVAGVVSELASAHPARDIQVHCGDAGTARWDGDRISQVLANLLGNAMAHGDPARPVRVQVDPAPELVELAVHNHGAVIPDETLPRLFEPFLRGKPGGGQQRSVGLGLYIVKEIVAAHGGTVVAASDPAQGTSFTVRLPRRVGAMY